MKIVWRILKIVALLVVLTAAALAVPHCVECHAGSYAEFQKVAEGQRVPLIGGQRFAAEPWESFARMSENDIGALYKFLHSLPPAAGPTGEASFRRD